MKMRMDMAAPIGWGGRCRRRGVGAALGGGGEGGGGGGRAADVGGGGVGGLWCVVPVLGRDRRGRGGGHCRLLLGRCGRRRGCHAVSQQTVQMSQNVPAWREG